MCKRYVYGNCVDMKKGRLKIYKLEEKGMIVKKKKNIFSVLYDEFCDFFIFVFLVDILWWILIF